MFKIAGQEHPGRRRSTQDVMQWMAPAVDTQLNQLFNPQFHRFKPGEVSGRASSASKDICRWLRVGI